MPAPARFRGRPTDDKHWGLKSFPSFSSEKVVNNIQPTAVQAGNGLVDIAGGSPAAAVQRTARSPRPTAAAGNQVLGAPTDPASAGFSRPAQIYGKLQQLLAQDPVQYKELVSKTADHVQKAADDATGHEKEFLAGLAQKFVQAAEGNIDALRPPSQNLDPRVAAYAKHGHPGHPSALLMRHADTGGPEKTNVGNKALDDAFGSLTQALGLWRGPFDLPDKTAA